MTEFFYATQKFVMQRKEAWIRKYKATPRYVKMPEWVVRNLMHIPENVIAVPPIPPFGSTSMLFCGLIVCPTQSIDTIDQIEVF